jgi:hypothetical protein
MSSAAMPAAGVGIARGSAFVPNTHASALPAVIVRACAPTDDCVQPDGESTQNCQ